MQVPADVVYVALSRGSPAVHSIRRLPNRGLYAARTFRTETENFWDAPARQAQLELSFTSPSPRLRSLPRLVPPGQPPDTRCFNSFNNTIDSHLPPAITPFAP